MNKKNQTLLQEIVHVLSGEFDNFQQAWQENTEEEIHKVNIQKKHKHIHTIFEKPIVSDIGNYFIQLKHYENRDTTKIVAQHILKLGLNKNGAIESQLLVSSGEGILSEDTASGEKLIWRKNGNQYIATSGEDNTNLTIDNNQFKIIQRTGFFSNEIPYVLNKCRHFSGWIEYPLPENLDSTYRMANLKLHDQGGYVQLQLADGTPIDYTVELTQLVYGKTIAIMKLAIYDLPINEVNYNSRAISYTWTNPKAKRIGINIRKIVSGWTLIESGYINSDNTNMEEDGN